MLFGFLIGFICMWIVDDIVRNAWFRNSIYDNSIYKQIDEYKLTEEYKIFKATKDIEKDN